MDIKKLAQLSDIQINNFNVNVSNNSMEKSALTGKTIMKKATNDTTYSEITLEEARSILITNTYNYAQNFVNKLTSGEVIYYPDGIIKLSYTHICDKCNGGYIGDGTASKTDPTKLLCPDCTRQEVIQEMFDFLNA